jgi:endo-beta-N-acetylglucosaminidase D
VTAPEDRRRPFTFDRRHFLAAAGVTFTVTALGGRSGKPTDRSGKPAARSACRDDLLTAATGAPSFPPTLTALQPKSPQDIQALLDYDPTADPNARYMRCQVPIAPRAMLPASTQANPKLDVRPEILSLNGFYNQFIKDAPWIGDTRYGYDQRPYITRFAQYQDYLGGWSGAQTIANPAYVDVAHRNGALGLGIIFQPYFSPTPGAVPDFITQDAGGNFLVGDKLVDLAAYFGYDGYFLNIEEITLTAWQASSLAAMFDSMHERARAKGMPTFYLQIYDAIWTDGTALYEERFDVHNAGWVVPGQRVDSIFIDYAWPQNFADPDYAHNTDYVATSVALAEQRSLDPFNVLFFGLDVEEENDGVHANALDYYADQVIPLNGDAPALASLALFAQSDRLFIRTRDQLGPLASNENDLISAIYVGDRKYWSGKAENPAIPATPVHPTVHQVVSPNWTPQYGVANFIPERTVLTSLPFTTRFNTGQGEQFFLAGSLAADRVWYSMSAQDMLPSWQWWTRDLSGGTGTGQLLNVDYDHTLAYDGGSCLHIAGRLSRAANTEVRLFKTAFDASQPAVISLLAHAGTAGSINYLRAGVSYLDQPTMTQWLTPSRPPHKLAHGWHRIDFDVTSRPGTLITALSIGALTPPGYSARQYSVYIGELRITAASRSPVLRAPQALTVDSARPSGNGSGPGLTVALSWQLAAGGVWYYDLRTSTSRPQWLGRVFGDAYVVDAIAHGTRIALVPVGFDGREGRHAVITVE